MRPHCFASYCALLLMGCSPGPPAPPVYPVQGIVLQKGKSLAGGAIEFRHLTDNQTTSLAEIEKDGTFRLRTVFEGRRLDGAPEGMYQVTVLPPPFGENKPASPVTLAQKTRVEPKANHLRLEID